LPEQFVRCERDARTGHRSRPVADAGEDVAATNADARAASHDDADDRPVSHTTAKPSASPSPSPSPTATPVDTLGAFVSPIGSPASSAIAFGSTQKPSNRGPLIGLAIGVVAVAAGAGLLFWFRTRGSGL